MVNVLPRRAVGESSPDEVTNHTILILVRALIITISALPQIRGFYEHLVVKIITIPLHFYIQERKFTSITPLAGEVEGLVVNEGVPEFMKVLLGAHKAEGIIHTPTVSGGWGELS